VAGRRKEGDYDSSLRPPDWAGLHARQVLLASGLEARLPAAMAVPDLAGRAAALITALQAAGGGDVAGAQSGAALQISSPSDPTPVLLDALLGQTDEERATAAAIHVLAAFIAVYDAGGSIRRLQGGDFTLEVTVATEAPGTSTPGMETAKWLMDDELLISAALGFR
jgi:hypothetical protein